MEQGIGLVAGTKQQTIEAHPFSTCQWRRLHILGTLYQWDSYLLCLTIAATILKRRQHDDIGLHVHNLLDDGVQAIAAVHNAACLDLLLDIRHLDILGVCHTHNMAAQPQFGEQGTVDGGKDGSTLNRYLDNCAVSEVCSLRLDV